jgi:hypothetical protein
MSNILTNPTLTGFSLGHYFTEKDGKVGTIENPDNWEFIAIPRETDPEKLPQSLHRDRGFVIAAGYRAWEGAYVQRGIPLQANQRYLAKAVFKPDINFPSQTIDLTAVTWRFRMVSADKVVEQDWDMTHKGQYKQEETFEFVFETSEALAVDYQFWARSVYAGNAADFDVYQLTLEPVAANYGGSSVPIIGSADVTMEAPVAKTTDNPTVETPAITEIVSESGKTLGDVLSHAEIDEIAAGLRALAVGVNQTAAAGLNKLAEALERLK